MFDNDQMKDTPVMKGSSQGCPRLRDSCKKAKGLDPIWNFMDYSDDACMHVVQSKKKSSWEGRGTSPRWGCFRIPWLC